MDTPPRALEGLRVLDQTQVMAGPFCAMLLADMGAEVIKIEPPGGDATRAMDLELAPGVSAPFLAVNRNKRGLVLDQASGGRARLERAGGHRRRARRELRPAWPRGWAWTARRSPRSIRG
jgi:crotonobetainyl-CoA:carnitine CoA-transferase CaiB-like acyl-CoA transferase